mmetsp:Transcript_7079/g.7188  ORF Transcript_7079/g.7188 Transcript_7079/m.7188 type:complete len:247 (-) Transcript_7079:792-1532(-)
MLFQEDDDTLSFISLLKSIQTETNVLKCVSSLRSLPQNDKLTSKIFEIENSVQNIEKNLEDFNEFLSSEMKTCEIMDNEIINIAEQQARKINELHTSYPLSLVDAIKNSKESTEDKKDQNMCLSEINNTIKQDELLLIPKSTRGRLTIGVVNGALRDIGILIKEKTKIISMPKKKMNRAQLKILEDFLSIKQADHGDCMFVSETDVRSTSIFEAGESTGKATLHTLRALHRIKLIRSSGENTYILI